MLKSFPQWFLKKKHWRKNLTQEFHNNLNFKLDDSKLVNFDHHESHAASAYYPSPYSDAAVLIVDGVGEFSTITIWKGENNQIKLLKEYVFPHSLGLLYSAFTDYCGFKVNSGEYKLMGLAPYGEAIYADVIRKELLIDAQDDVQLNMKYFTFPYKSNMTNKRFEKLFNHPARQSESKITQHYMNVAASIQVVLEEQIEILYKKALELTGSNNLCLAGGVALNCVANGNMRSKKYFENIWIQPAAGDAGGALGAALLAWNTECEVSNIAAPIDSMSGAYLGPGYTNNDVKSYLDSVGAKYVRVSNPSEKVERIADLISTGMVVGWHQGRMEFGPRALGARSILGDPTCPEMQRKMNLKIKFRESFRPFAPSVLLEQAPEFFSFSGISPYMLNVAPIEDSQRVKISESESKLQGIEKLKARRSSVPAITHVNYSARLQTVCGLHNPLYHQLLSQMRSLTGIGMLINTSFNVRGEPIVCSPEDSYRCFMRTEMDILCIEDFILYKADQPKYDVGNWREEFALD